MTDTTTTTTTVVPAAKRADWMRADDLTHRLRAGLYRLGVDTLASPYARAHRGTTRVCLASDDLACLKTGNATCVKYLIRLACAVVESGDGRLPTVHASDHGTIRPTHAVVVAPRPYGTVGAMMDKGRAVVLMTHRPDDYIADLAVPLA